MLSLRLAIEEFERNAIANGMVVHWARDAAEHNQIVYDILSTHGATTLVKSKSMLTDECEMRPFLENRGIEVDRDRSRRAHPAARRRAAEPHRRAGGAQAARRRRRGVRPHASAPIPKNSDVHYLAESQRAHTRPYYPEGARPA